MAKRDYHVVPRDGQWPSQRGLNAPRPCTARSANRFKLAVD